MRIPLTKYGWPEVLLLPLAVLVIMLTALLAAGRDFLPFWLLCLTEAILALLLVWSLTFFRDPNRTCPNENNLLLAPADGTITDIQVVRHQDFIGPNVLKIGIFLSIFNAHINRAPCNAEVHQVTYRKGKHKNAMNPRSAAVNECAEVCLTRSESPEDKIVVRQISGAIARRIVCRAQPGQNLSSGEKFGMIKFGSRTELCLPARQNAKTLIKIGDKVKAGITPLVRYL